MGLKKEKTDQKFTYKEYDSWPEDERWELINGVAYDMSPAPSIGHQWMSTELARRLGNHLENMMMENLPRLLTGGRMKTILLNLLYLRVLVLM